MGGGRAIGWPSGRRAVRPACCLAAGRHACRPAGWPASPPVSWPARFWCLRAPWRPPAHVSNVFLRIGAYRANAPGRGFGFGPGPGPRPAQLALAQWLTPNTRSRMRYSGPCRGPRTWVLMNVSHHLRTSGCCVGPGPGWHRSIVMRASSKTVILVCARRPAPRFTQLGSVEGPKRNIDFWGVCPAPVEAPKTYLFQ